VGERGHAAHRGVHQQGDFDPDLPGTAKAMGRIGDRARAHEPAGCRRRNRHDPRRKAQTKIPVAPVFHRDRDGVIGNHPGEPSLKGRRVGLEAFDVAEGRAKVEGGGCPSEEEVPPRDESVIPVG
jgi:hypothetical protein